MVHNRVLQCSTGSASGFTGESSPELSVASALRQRLMFLKTGGGGGGGAGSVCVQLQLSRACLCSSSVSEEQSLLS